MIKWYGPIRYGALGEEWYLRVGGVYLIVEKNNEEIVRYVGQSSNIIERMRQHQNEESNKALKALLVERTNSAYVYDAIVVNPIDRNDLELTAFEKYGGLGKLYNKIIPQGNLLPNINFPIQ